MKSRTKLLLIGLALAVLTFAVIELFFVVHPGVTVQNAGRIQVGMSLGEVEWMLGRPADVSEEFTRDGLLYTHKVWGEGEGAAFVFVSLGFVWSDDVAEWRVSALRHVTKGNGSLQEFFDR